MSKKVPPASIDAPYPATSADAIEVILSSAEEPLDTICGLLATDPALLLHFMRKSSESRAASAAELSLRRMAATWLERPDHRWYRSILPAAQSSLSPTQRRQHQRLCRRSAIAAGLIGEWQAAGLESLREGAELAELHAVIAVSPSLLRLCRIEDGSAYTTVEEERAAWLTETSNFMGAGYAKACQPSDDNSSPAAVAVDIAAATVRDSAEDFIERKLPEWARRLARDTAELREDVVRVRQGVDALANPQSELPVRTMSRLISGQSERAERDTNCLKCRQRAYGNALSTVRNRLTQNDVTIVELIDHLMYAACNCGSLKRTNWYSLDSSKRILHSRRRKSAEGTAVLDAGELQVAEIPILQVLMERPRSVQVHPEMRLQMHQLLPQTVNGSFGQHYLCASVFCGSVPMGVLYADADGAAIGASEAGRFRAVAQLATKMATLLALRSHRRAIAPDISQLAYPEYASFDPNIAANESGESLLGKLSKQGSQPR